MKKTAEAKKIEMQVDEILMGLEGNLYDIAHILSVFDVALMRIHEKNDEEEKRDSATRGLAQIAEMTQGILKECFATIDRLVYFTGEEEAA